MSIIKRIKRKRYFTADSRAFEDADLSWKAKGLLAYIFSRPPGWTIRMKDLEERSTDGPHALRTGIKELIGASYARYETERDEDTGQLAGKTLSVREALDIQWDDPPDDAESPPDKKKPEVRETPTSAGTEMQTSPRSGFSEDRDTMPFSNNDDLVNNRTTNKKHTSSLRSEGANAPQEADWSSDQGQETAAEEQDNGPREAMAHFQGELADAAGRNDENLAVTRLFSRIYLGTAEGEEDFSDHGRLASLRGKIDGSDVSGNSAQVLAMSLIQLAKQEAFDPAGNADMAPATLAKRVLNYLTKSIQNHDQPAYQSAKERRRQRRDAAFREFDRFLGGVSGGDAGGAGQPTRPAAA